MKFVNDDDDDDDVLFCKKTLLFTPNKRATKM